MPSENNLFSGKLTEGDAKAFESFFKLYYSRLVLFANRFLNDIPASEEIVSDIFVMLWESGHEINFTGSVRSYLYRCVQNRSLNYLKHQQVENLYVNYLQKKHLLEDLSLTSDSAFMEKEMQLQIKTALDSLPEKCREIFIMSRFEHMKYKEIAEALELSPKTVERQIGIALDKLRKLLKHVVYMMF